MEFSSKNVTPVTVWIGAEKGAAVYGHDDSRQFERQLAEGKILGARKVNGVWQSHPKGAAGSVRPAYERYELPRNTAALTVKGITPSTGVIRHGTISYALPGTGSLHISPHLNLNYPKVGISATRLTFAELCVDMKTTTPKSRNSVDPPKRKEWLRNFTIEDYY
ncbi:MAG: hypothetical protein WC749_05260 [Dehalococcoidia bacterium]